MSLPLCIVHKERSTKAGIGDLEEIDLEERVLMAKCQISLTDVAETICKKFEKQKSRRLNLVD